MQEIHCQNSPWLAGARLGSIPECCWDPGPGREEEGREGGIEGRLGWKGKLGKPCVVRKHTREGHCHSRRQQVSSELEFPANPFQTPPCPREGSQTASSLPLTGETHSRHLLPSDGNQGGEKQQGADPPQGQPCKSMGRQTHEPLGSSRSDALERRPCRRSLKKALSETEMWTPNSWAPTCAPLCCSQRGSVV